MLFIENQMTYMIQSIYVESNDVPSKQFLLIEKPFINEEYTINKEKKMLIDIYMNCPVQENVNIP
jgi:hypothetical protein